MKKSETLERLFANQVIEISAVNGSKTILNSEGMFRAGIDSDFKDWDLNKSDEKTPEIKARVYKIVPNANFKQIFSSLNDDLDKLCLTQHQIVEFCIKSQKYLEDAGATSFLFKERKWWQFKNRYFVAFVIVGPDGLYFGVNRFEYVRVWRAAFAHRVVVPELNLEN